MANVNVPIIHRDISSLSSNSLERGETVRGVTKRRTSTAQLIVQHVSGNLCVFWRCHVLTGGDIAKVFRRDIVL
jgi:hypothetical protein